MLTKRPLLWKMSNKRQFFQHNIYSAIQSSETVIYLVSIRSHLGVRVTDQLLETTFRGTIKLIWMPQKRRFFEETFFIYAKLICQRTQFANFAGKIKSRNHWADLIPELQAFNGRYKFCSSIFKMLFVSLKIFKVKWNLNLWAWIIQD